MWPALAMGDVSCSVAMASLDVENELFFLSMRDTVERSYGFTPASRRRPGDL